MKIKILIILLVLIVLGVGGFLVVKELGLLGGPPRESGPSGEVKYEIREPTDITQLTFLYHASDPDWSPDGSRIAFEGRKDETDDPGLYLINADGTGLTKIGPEHNPSWSPVDNRILLREDREQDRNLIIIDLDKGWESKTELASQINEQGSWSPDGKKIVYSSSNGSIWVMNSDGSEKIRLTTNEDGFCMVPSFNYDGSKIVYLKGFTAYMIGAENIEPNEIWVMNADGSDKHKIYAPGDSAQMIFQRAWNKDNKILFMRTWYHAGKYPQIWVINSDGSDSKLLVSGGGAFTDPVWDNTGTKVAFSKTPPPSIMGSNIWAFSYEEPKDIFQTIWEKILDFFK